MTWSSSLQRSVTFKRVFVERIAFRTYNDCTTCFTLMALPLLKSLDGRSSVSSNVQWLNYKVNLCLSTILLSESAEHPGDHGKTFVSRLLSSILNSLWPCNSASERKRRQVYRGEVHGQLPFDTRGMDDLVPTIDFSPSGNLDGPYSFEREDVNSMSYIPNIYFRSNQLVIGSGLFRVLDELERFARASNDPVALNAIRESRVALEKLVAKMDSLESGFDRIAERSCEQ
jgi:hypothetical protein